MTKEVGDGTERPGTVFPRRKPFSRRMEERNAGLALSKTKGHPDQRSSACRRKKGAEGRRSRAASVPAARLGKGRRASREAGRQRPG